MKKKLLRLSLLILILQSPVWSQTVIRDIKFYQIEKYKPADYIKWSGLRRGGVWTAPLIRQANHRIISALQQRGFLFARIDSVSVRNVSDNQYDLNWYIHEDLPFRLDSLTIKADSLAPAEVEDVVDLPSGMVYNEDVIADELLRINEYHARYGYPLSKTEIRNFQLRKTDNEYRINLDIFARAGNRILIDEIHIRGNQVTKENVIIRETDVQPGELYDQSKINAIPAKLNRLGFFKDVQIPRLRILPDGRNVIMIEVTEGNTTTFDGIVGYVPPVQNGPDADGYFTGLIRLNFRNLFGTARKLEVDWKKPDRFSDEFRIYYEEPWIFGYAINVGGSLQRLVRDTTYIENTVSLNSTLRLTSELRGIFSVVNRSVIPDSIASADLRLSRTRVLSTELGIEYDTRDFPLNPRSGIYYSTVYSLGLKKNQGPQFLLEEDNLPQSEEIQSFRVRLAYFNELWRNQVLAVNFNGGKIKSAENRLQLSDHFWFGGAQTLRGYRENQLHGTTVSWLNLEYRFITGRDSRIFLFNDWGFYNYTRQGKTEEDILPGYGLGLRFESPLGIMSVDYGLGRGDSFSTGKIHFGIVNQF